MFITGITNICSMNAQATWLSCAASVTRGCTHETQGKGGYGINPQPSWQTPSAFVEYIERPQIGDEVDFRFSSPRTEDALAQLGLALDGNKIILKNS